MQQHAEKAMAPHSSTLAWKIPWTEEPGRPAVPGVAKSQTRLNDFPFTFHFHALEKEMATHSSVLAWRIPGTEEPGGLPSLGSHRVGHDWSDLLTAAATWVQLEIIIQRDRRTSSMWYHLYMESKIWHKSTYLWSKNRIMDKENRLSSVQSLSHAQLFVTPWTATH